MPKSQSLLFFQLLVFAVVAAMATCALRRAHEETTPATNKIFNQATLAAKGN
jgi:hypothetical protein